MVTILIPIQPQVLLLSCQITAGVLRYLLWNGVGMPSPRQVEIGSVVQYSTSDAGTGRKQHICIRKSGSSEYLFQQQASWRLFDRVRLLGSFALVYVHMPRELIGTSERLAATRLRTQIRSCPGMCPQLRYADGR